MRIHLKNNRYENIIRIHFYNMRLIIQIKAIPVLLCTGLLISACTVSKDKETEEEVQIVLPEGQTEVTAIKLEEQEFTHELVSNGKVEAAESAELYFQSPQTIARIHVKNGDRVRKGQKIAELDRFKLQNATLQAKESLEQANLEFQEVLIGQGYTLKDSARIPAETMRLAKLRSGYEQRKSQYDLARYEESQAVLVAPFDGIVANLFQKTNNTANTSVSFCRVIHTQKMETTFTVLESELPLIKVGDRVSITPYADREARHEGLISQINPLVDDKGMVTVKASVSGSSRLFEGMNVRVYVQRSMGRTLVVPKTAVVLRNGKQVVFTLKDGVALWNYVQIGLENSDSYTLVEGLSAGDSVITTGNINLAHQTKVVLVTK